MKPIIFIIGLSGVGKTCTANVLSMEYSLRNIDIDCKDGFARAGFPPEWDHDFNNVDFSILTNTTHGLLDDFHQGAVLSFPTTCRFNKEQLSVALANGIGTIILWGELEQCWNVRCKRQKMNKGTVPPKSHYLRKNEPTFKMYQSPEYDELKVNAFLPNGFRSSKDILKLVLIRLSAQGIDLIKQPYNL